MNNPLNILGLSPGDSLKLAKKKRNALFLKLHPDKNKKDEKKYMEVYNAYDLLERNPSLLDPPILKNAYLLNEYDIKAYISVTIKDIYFRNTINASVERQIFCKKCDGTKSKNGIKSNCPQCDGKGQIKSQVLELLKKSPICPKCKGIGVPPEDICDKCKGIGTETERLPISFNINFAEYHKKKKLILDAGNQISHNKFGALILFLNFKPDLDVKIEDEYFVVYDKVLPIQKIIGDEKIIRIFDRVVFYKIEKNSLDAYAIDKISNSLSQEIRIKFIDIVPKITVETMSLYLKILEIEKRQHCE